jgi:hypothetical protein
MNEKIKDSYESKEVYLNNPEDIKLAYWMYEHNIDLSSIE